MRTVTVLFNIVILFLISAVSLQAIPRFIKSISTPEGNPVSYEQFKDNLLRYDVIFAGEEHTNYAHHLLQLDILQTLHNRGRQPVIGAEMFSFTVNPALKRFTAGDIHEETFLRESHYFSRWGYDYRLYRPLFLYARINRIRLAGLNQPKEITSTVFRKGIQQLSPEQMQMLPSRFDLSQHAYVQRLRKIYSAHSAHAGKSGFERFLLAQLIWDETMSEKAAELLKAAPGSTLLVIAGNGHLYDDAIPGRLCKRYNLSCLVIRPDANGHSDYQIETNEVKFKGSPSLGILATGTDKGIQVSRIMKGSNAEGVLKEKDVIISISSEKITTLADLRIALFKAAGSETISLTVLREGRREKLQLRL